ncbi:MAG: hypothetical protein HOB40_07330 [Candidatus Marinimicrobia bacterium]|jgi:hypothetical protein|nr:hypothetical protein [Candidatus Neomarinimicrobiota bacterium]MBT6937184.1 hypothetical protein [Candidatus Neomarinimicrobiota bacterium]
MENSRLLNCGLCVMHCVKQWEDFEKTGNPDTRFCPLCRKKVILVSSKRDVKRVLKQKNSVAYKLLEE